MAQATIDVVDLTALSLPDGDSLCIIPDRIQARSLAIYVKHTDAT